MCIRDRHRRALGEQVASGSEKNIPTYEEWQAKNSQGEIFSWSDYDGDEEEVSSRRRPRPPSNE